MRSRDRLKLLLIDAILVLAGIYGAIVVRFANIQLDMKWVNEPRTLAYLALEALILTLYYQAGLYNRLPRYSGLQEAILIVTRTTLAVVPFMLVALLSGGAWLARSIIGLAWFLVIGMVGGTRAILRILSERKSLAGGPLRRVVIVGANDAGENTERELSRSQGYDVIGFVDPDPDKQGMTIRGTPIMGTLRELPSLVASRTVDEIVVTENRPALIQDIVSNCDLSKTALRVIPSVVSLMDGRIRVQLIRDVRIEDLLEREPIQLDMTALRSVVAGQTVMVTGAGGSIGSEICRQLAQLEPARLVLVGRGENSIYEVSLELKDVPYVPVIADIRDAIRMRKIFEKYRPRLVFHAAAHKHVPLMEANVTEAVSVNVLGTWLLMDLAHQLGVERFVLLSTDKAASPTSMMGASKRMAELLLRHRAQDSATRFTAVRFGNVLGSRGSVVPTFRRQIAEGGPVTITHPDMTRFFMTIPEAVQLVLQAATLAQGGEIYILDMGKPVRIVDLARNLIRLSGFEPDRDIIIKIDTTPRPGEKLTEELLNPNESSQPTRIAKLLGVQSAEPAPGAVVSEWLTQFETAVRNDDSQTLRSLLLEFTQLG
ncbi:MAG TPA: nucleoside-diphosphate sugar epimerase/dehydratase [Candidatus Xenobia bacterium]